MIDNFIEDLKDEIDATIRYATLGFAQGSRVVLGGVAGPDGGSGSPPAGFLGKLIQRYVAYDTTEAAQVTGSATLLDNLNHIRYRLQVLESGGGAARAFLDLTDVPDSYSGQAGKVVLVAEDETSLEFADYTPPTGNDTALKLIWMGW